MQWMFIIVFLIFNSVVIICDAQQDDGTDIQIQFGWLNGIYKYENVAEDTYEEWHMPGDTLKGRSFEVKNSDTLITEELEIFKGKDKLIYYIATVKNQNQGKPVYFKLISNDSNRYVFENLEHDFPERIIYFREGKDIRVSLQGEDVSRTVEFILRKIR
ncbi:DUF6265 family protein [Bacteroidota bacterium]